MKTKHVLPVILCSFMITSGVCMQAYAGADIPADGTYTETQTESSGDVIISDDEISGSGMVTHDTQTDIRNSMLDESREQAVSLDGAINAAYQSFQESNRRIASDTLLGLRTRYNALTMFQRTYVSSYPRLVEMEQATQITYDISAIRYADGATVKTGTDYTLMIAEESPYIEMVMRYVTDIDGDGVNERPEFTLIAPDGSRTVLSTQTSEFKGDTVSMTLDWQERFLKITIDGASKGLWTIASSLPVQYTRNDTAEPAEVIENVTPSPSTGYDSTGEPDDVIISGDGGEEGSGEPEEPGNTDYTPIILFGIIVAAIAAGFVILLKKLNKKAEPSDKSGRSEARAKAGSKKTAGFIQKKPDTDAVKEQEAKQKENIEEIKDLKNEIAKMLDPESYSDDDYYESRNKQAKERKAAAEEKQAFEKEDIKPETADIEEYDESPSEDLKQSALAEKLKTEQKAKEEFDDGNALFGTIFEDD